MSGGGSDEWTGWWGDDPPYHHPVFVLTHHPRPSITMQGGTTFHFVDDGIEVALEGAFDAAGGQDVRLGGGPATIQQYLRAGLVDEMHVAIVPILLGGGERLFDHLDGGAHGYECRRPLRRVQGAARRLPVDRRGDGRSTTRLSATTTPTGPRSWPCSACSNG